MLSPAKTHPPLIVDANVVLALPISSQGLKAMGRWEPKVRQFLRRGHALESLSGATPDIGGYAANMLSEIDAFGVLAFESFHAANSNGRR